jgi:hypothetical protein
MAATLLMSRASGGGCGWRPDTYLKQRFEKALSGGRPAIIAFTWRPATYNFTYTFAPEERNVAGTSGKKN